MIMVIHLQNNMTEIPPKISDRSYRMPAAAGYKGPLASWFPLAKDLSIGAHTMSNLGNTVGALFVGCLLSLL